jgi:hypothetical protein
MTEKGRNQLRPSDYVVAAAIFVTTLIIFVLSPVHQVTDSNYSMYLSDCLLRSRTFALDACGIPVLEPKPLNDYITNGGIYQLEIQRGRVYYFFPVGSSVLSVPYVAAAKLFGVSPRNTDGSFNVQGEMAIELGLAAFLMALLSAMFFFTSRLLLSLNWSVLLALGGSLGTQIWSTASRGLWSHTWSALLAGCVVYLLVSADSKGRKPNAVLLATLVSWMYFVRPTNSIVVLALSIFVLLRYRNLFLAYAVTGAVWLILFFVYSWHNFGEPFPHYYRASRLLFDVFPVALKGNLISPSRGLLVFVPSLVFVAYLLIRYWSSRPLRELTWLALAVVAATLIVVSGFAHWWGGASFGPRFTTDAVPWFVLLAIIGVKAVLNWREQNSTRTVSWAIQMTCGAVLLAASIFINARGALAVDTWRWNPGDVSQLGNKLWDWRYPQFLAGLIPPPLDHDYALLPLGKRINFNNNDESAGYLWYGWSNAEETFRWTEGKNSTLVFALDQTKDLILKMKIVPFVREGLLKQQRIFVELNGTPIDSLVFNRNPDTEVSITLPGRLLRQKNVIKFKIPDAASPELLKISTDQRLLGFAVFWIELHPAASSSSLLPE